MTERRQGQLRKLTIPIAVGMALGLSSVAYADTGTTKIRINLREAPDLNTAVVATLPQGSELQVLGYEGEFAMLQTADGDVGYLKTKYLEVVEAAPEPVAVEDPVEVAQVAAPPAAAAAPAEPAVPAELSTSDGPTALDRIAVTGSRIVREDYLTSSPVLTIDREAIRLTGTINIEDFMNTLPQIVPSIASGNNNPGNGQANIDLRGLGPERTLILINGKRMTPSDSDATVDINTIPTSMIERVEVLSGGASAVYGTDAVAGAVNFILRNDIDGAELSVQRGESFEGDAGTTNIELLMGSDLAEGRGNITAWATYNNREALSKGDREFSAQAVSLTSFFPSGHIRRASGNSWTLDAVQDVFTNLYGANAPTALGTLVGNDDGTLFTQGAAGEGVINFREVIGQGIDGNFVSQNFIDGGDGVYSYNFEPFNNLLLPQERLSFGSMLNLALNDKVDAYMRGQYTNYSSDTRLAPAPAPTSRNITNPDAGFEFTVPVTNPFVQNNQGLSQILASRTGDNVGLEGSGANEEFIYRRRFIENGPRIESYERDVHQLIGGIKGEFADGWYFDAYLGTGRYNEQLSQNGNVSTTRVEQLLDAPDGGTSLCEGGLNIVGANTLSADCVDFVGVLAKNTTSIEHSIAEAVVSGDLMELAGGYASAAFGAFWQEFRYEFLADEILATGDVSGFNAQDNLNGTTRNADLFGEVALPVLPTVEATLGFRYSDHNIAGAANAYKAEVNWAAMEGLNVRGSLQRAVRAPNVFELFSPQNEDNPQVQDPCNFDSGERTGPDAAQVRQLCIDQGIPESAVDTYTQSTDQISAFEGGNPNLEEETADTYTVGFVWQPSFARDLQMSMDYYSIEVESVIQAVDPSFVVGRCFNLDDSNPNYSADNEWCQRFGRSPTSSEIIDLLQVQENIGGLRTDGIDLQVDWRTELGQMGSLGVNFVSTYLLEWAEQQQPGAPFIDFAGSIGDDLGEVFPDFRATLTTVWDYQNVSTGLRARYIPSMVHEEAILSGSSDPEACGCTGVGSIFYVDLFGSVSVTPDISLIYGIDNLLDEEPEFFTPDLDSGTNPSVYDVVGRRWRLLAQFNF